MRIYLLVILLYICSTQLFIAQESDGVVAFALPLRNSLTFNRYLINPTFSFVREQNKFISFYNKREWVQFDDAPNTYLGSYSGRFGENIGAGLGVFQQNYGVLTTFGGVLNFAYNVGLSRDSNLTFGLNVGAYSSGINTSNVVTNFDDPSLQNVPSNFLLAVNPGINYGNAFLDFGVSINNLVLYNFQSSLLIEDNPAQGIQAHVMYTGYMASRGFFDEAKFSGLIRSEFTQDNTIVSGLAMLTVPLGIWAQAGYNSVYGISGGLGLNITKEIAIEYNFEKGIGDLMDFGPSHEITIAYRFKNKDNYYYSGDDEVSGLFSTPKKRQPSKRVTTAQAQENRRLAEERRAQAKLEADNKVKAAALAKATADAERKAEADAEAQAKLTVEQNAKAEAEAQAILAAEQKAKAEAEAQAILAAEQKAKAEAEAQAKLAAEQKAKSQAEAQAKLAAEQKAKAEAEAQAKLVAEQKAKAKAEAEAQAKLLAEQKAKAEAEAQALLIAQQNAKAEAAAQAKLAAEQKAKIDAEAQALLLAEQKAKTEEELISNPQDELGKSMYALTKLTEDSEAEQQELLSKFNEAVAIKDQNLKDLKEENDLSEQGIAVEPKPFKSITAENNALNAVKTDLDNIIEQRSQRIKELNTLYEDMREGDTITNETVLLYYKRTIKRLTSEQATAIETRTQLESKLEAIRVATEFERRRRIKRAAYSSEEDRYEQDRNVLNSIRQNTALSNAPLKQEDFDFGEEQSKNIQILKNIKNVDNGYYLIIAVHNDVVKRDNFIKKVVASGRKDVDFFYDVNTSKYYIYYTKANSIESANDILKSKGDRPYNAKMSVVKIEN